MMRYPLLFFNNKKMYDFLAKFGSSTMASMLDFFLSFVAKVICLVLKTGGGRMTSVMLSSLFNRMTLVML